jgi:selenocysteine lyase/cysteine desulfurase
MHKSLFPTAEEVTYLDTAAEGLPAPHYAEAFSEYCLAKGRGTPGRAELHAVEAATLALAGRLLGTERTNVAFLSCASEALNLLALSFDWRPGDRAIISDLEFPSNVLPWVRLKEMGVDIVVVPSRQGALREADIIEQITPKTRLVSLSLVSYKTGAYVAGVPRIAAASHKVGAAMSLDVTQALGRCPVCLEGVDYLMSSSFKWLLGPHGLGIVYVAPSFRQQFKPASVGWYSVKDLFSPTRFTSYDLKDGAACLSAGMPNFPSIYVLRRALEFLLQVGVERIFEELKPVVARLRQGLADLGLQLLTPPDRDLASGIVAFAHPQAKEIGAKLARERVIAWAGDGRVRASVHLYNDLADVERYLTILASILQRGSTREKASADTGRSSLETSFEIPANASPLPRSRPEDRNARHKNPSNPSSNKEY